MLYHIIYPLKYYISGCNVFRYITFRSGLAFLIAFIVSLWTTTILIKIFSQRSTQAKRKYVPDTHLEKQGTPSMGGITIIVSVIVSVIITGNFSNPNVNLCLISMILFGLLGFVDDVSKVHCNSGFGVTVWTKFASQVAFSLVLSFYLYFLHPHNAYLSGDLQYPISISSITVPFFHNWEIDISIFYVMLVAFILVGSSNAVNLTDGLDGLAIGLTLICVITFTAVAYISGHQDIAEYLKIPFIPASGEMTVFLSALAGSCIGFLWFNCHPAQIFMGDTGSLALGAALGLVSILLKSELLYILIGGVFVLETISVILQVASFKLRKKRIWKMTPIHHHFELCGVHENKIIMRMWITGLAFSVLAISSLKLR